VNPDKVILKEDLFYHYQYHKGDIFTIVDDDNWRGWNIKHDKTGNMIYECRFIHDLFDSYNIKEERKDKLKRINN